MHTALLHYFYFLGFKCDNSQNNSEFYCGIIMKSVHDGKTGKYSENRF